MKGYKASINSICKDQLYEVGKTYKIKGKLKICENGFHFCEKIDDVLFYYKPNQDLVLFEVEALGEVITDYNKSVTDEIKIVREIPVSEWNDLFTNHQFDERKNLIYKKYSYCYKCHYKYDDNNNRIYEKDSYGNEYHWKYDENNNLIYEKLPNGREYHYKYDKNNNLNYIKYPSGKEWYWEYDKNKNLIYQKDSNGNEFHWKYDKNNNLIYEKLPSGNEWYLNTFVKFKIKLLKFYNNFF